MVKNVPRLVRIRDNGLNHLMKVVLWFLILLMLVQGTALAAVGVDDSWYCQAPILPTRLHLTNIIDDETCINHFSKIDELPTIQWNQTYGCLKDDYAAAVIQATSRGFVIVGSTWSFGTGTGDAWLIKTDASGNLKWLQTFGGAEDDEARSLIKTTDGGFVLGGFTSSSGAGERDAWLVKVVPPGVDLTDTDGDGLTDKEEVEICKTDPLDDDSDDDTYSDGEEVAEQTDPKDPLDYPETTLQEMTGGGESSFVSIIKIGVLIIAFVVVVCVLILIPRYFRLQRYKKALKAYSRGEGSVEEIAKRFFIPVRELERVLREHDFDIHLIENED